MNNIDKYQDEELFDLIKEGRSYALKILFKKYYERLCHFADTIINDNVLSEEIVSDIFVNIWEKREQININYKVKSYLFTAVKNQSINYLKKRKLHTVSLYSAVQEKTGDSANPEEKLLYDELKEKVDNIIDKLPEKRKLIFQMNRFDGFTFQEIADILSLSVFTVRNQMVKAIKFLAKQYQQFK